MLKKGIVIVAVAVAASVMAAVSYSYITGSLLNRDGYVLREGTGIFWESNRPVRGQEAAPQLGYPAPDFTLDDLEGRSIALSELQGRPVLLNFWASWCPPCRAEMPDLQDFHTRYGDQVTVLGINWAEDLETVRAFLERYGITYPNVLDPQGRAFVMYRLTGLPTSFFLDEQGIIRGVWLGPLRTDDIARDFSRITDSFQLRSPENGR